MFFSGWLDECFWVDRVPEMGWLRWRPKMLKGVENLVKPTTAFFHNRIEKSPFLLPFARMELDRIRAGLGEGGLRFKSSVQELRFEPSYRSGSAVWRMWDGRGMFWEDRIG